jgi:hypothetical protein
MSRLSGLAALQYLYLARTHVTDTGLSRLAALKQLRKLVLSETHITDAGLTQMLRLPLPPLHTLDVRGARVSAAGAAALRSYFPRAQLEWSEPNRRAAEAVLKAGGTVDVRIAGQEKDSSAKTAAELPLQYFRLKRAVAAPARRPSSEFLQSLASLTDAEFDDLAEVDLSGSTITDADLESLAALPCRRLVLNRTPLTGPGIRHLKKLPRLTDLSLECPTLSFLGIQYLTDFKGLSRLSLAGSGVNDGNVTNLCELVNLRELDLSDTMVTTRGIAELKNALPKCQLKTGSRRQQ